jgi:2-C-methyl-D-erythritol 4-phosphate cytidylyltransferase
VSRQLLIPAGGMGHRLGAALPKALVPLGGTPLLIRTLAAFTPSGLANTAVIAIPETHRAAFQSALDTAFPGHQMTLVDGGAERQDSVRNGLAALRPETVLCAIHDAARPFVSSAAIEAALEAADLHGAATVAIPSADTILVGDGDAFLQDTPDRSLLWACQTPQCFRVEIIRSAHEEAVARAFKGTDDATLVRRCGHSVKLVEGASTNIKVTTPADLHIAEALLEQRQVCE